MLTGNYLIFYNQLSKAIAANQLLFDPLNTLAYGTDASFYRLIPKMVIKAKDENEIRIILQEAAKLQISLTFRAAGTSLSGQSITDSVLVIAGSDWKKFEIQSSGQFIKLQPGLIGSKVNQLLAPFQRKIGPDPASINSAMIGGIAANNASGMCCGTADNSYQTVVGMRIIIADGSILDTNSQQSKNAFLESHPDLINKIIQLSSEVQANQTLSERIKFKFRIKNTMGYSLNSLVDFTDPFEIITHLMIGSEGTLGFISEITYRTIDELPFRASAMIIFPDIEKACMAVPLLKSQHVSTAELIDRSGLRSVADEPGMPLWIKNLSNDATALLVETVAQNKEILQSKIESIIEAIDSIPVEIPVKFTSNPVEYGLYWKIRKGLFPSVGAVRQTGTTVIIEDVAFPIVRLAEATIDLQQLFSKYHYAEAVIFGHALEGNLHFVFTQDFSDHEEITRYQNFMKEVVELVIGKYDGSLKAEHGTGRNMAPFVEFEWGKEAYELMKQIKEIFDPWNLLNPGVILNNDPKIHLKNLKPLTAAHEKIDKCIECGFCESSCVSAGLTLSPRQRITVYREICRLKASGEEPHVAAVLINSFSYAGNDTCATDGLCAISCPVKIDTGKLIKSLRFDDITSSQAKIANWIASNFSLIISFIRGSLQIVAFIHQLLGSKLLGSVSATLRKISMNSLPHWTPAMPKGANKIAPSPITESNPKKMVYFPSCINRAMGISKDSNYSQQLTEVVQELIVKAGFEIIFPDQINNLCCGMAFSSKGYTDAGLKKSKELEDALWKASNQGEYPILCDMSPCLYTMRENMGERLKLYEPVEFILNYLMPYLDIIPLDETISVFIVCSMKKMGLEQQLIKLAEMCAREVIVPETTCCGFAGDRGFTYPELNAHGLQYLKEQIPSGLKLAFSTSRTCEIGLSTHSGVNHQSIVYLVNQCSKSKL